MEVVAALCGVIGALVTALGIIVKRLKDTSGGNNDVNQSRSMRREFTTQVSLCNERFITLASTIGSVNTALTNMNDRQSRLEAKIDTIIAKGHE